MLKTDPSGINVVGINIEYFAKNCWYLKGSMEVINKRLLTAAGKYRCFTYL